MALKPRLAPSTSQTLAMTPRLQQAIKLLQMSNLDVRAYLDEIAERNPLVDIEASEESAAPKPAATGPPDQPEGLFRSRSSGAVRTSDTRSGPIGDGSALDLLEAPKSLRDHLGRQLRLKRLPPDVAILAHLLIDELDDDGYLRTPLFELADRAGVIVDLIERALKALQSCSPAGLGARSLSECLALQLKDRNCLDTAMAVLLDNLTLVADKNSRQLEELTGETPKALALRLSILRSLDPKPGLGFVHVPVQTVVPDIIVHKGQDGLWAIELNTETLPSVLIDNRYAARIGTGDAKTDVFLSDCRKQVTWLTNALNQRAKTILRVASEIVRRQNGFFENGVAHLKPMTLKAIGDRLGVHESTVSRAASEKYLICPRGIFELKFFFATGLRGNGGKDDVSAVVIRERIRKLILGENPSAPLSDGQIVTELSVEGMVVARRTVAKYRERMSIPSSVRRRRRNTGIH